ncbi:MAG: hypothetical protein R3F46_01070 [bacterium]
MILGWIFVHGGTKGTYRVQSLSNVSATVGGFMLLISLAAFGIGIGADPGFGFSVPLAAVCWLTILLLRSSLSSDAKGNEEVRLRIARQMLEEQRRFQREQRFETPDQIRERVQEAERQFLEQQERSRAQVERIMQRPPAVKPAPADPAAAAPELDGALRLAGRELQPALPQEEHGRRQDLSERFELRTDKALSGPSQAARADMKPQTPQHMHYVSGMDSAAPEAEAPNVLHVGPEPDSEQGYHSDVDEVMQIARDTIANMAGATHVVQPPQAATEPVIVEETSSPEVESAPVPEPEFVPQQGWQAPKIEHARYELDNAGEKPVSMFGQGPAAGSGQSLFAGSGQRPLQASAASEVDRLLAANRLNSNQALTRPQAVLAGTDTPGAVESRAPQPPDDGNIVEDEALLPDSELTKPKRVLEEAGKGQGPGFHYKPTEGIKSRF